MALPNLILVALVVLPASLQASEVEVNANPIRKVVTLLQMMQKKVQAEGEKETELYEKFMCYCKNGASDLGASIDAAGSKITSLSSDIKAAEEDKAGTKEALKEAQADRQSAKESIAKATAAREKEAKEYAAYKSEADADINAVLKAIDAIEAGMSGGFLQTGTAQVLKQIVTSQHGMSDDDRQELLSFLSGSSKYAPQSGQIVGILKTIGDEMNSGLMDATATEKTAIKEYKALMAAKSKEVAALTKSIEQKLKKIGELGVAIAAMKNDLGDTEEALIEDRKFLGDLEKNCATKTGEYEEHMKVRAQELVALADTIKILNDDDALELFKKTLPAPSASFMQVGVKSSVNIRANARSALSKINWISPADRPQLDLLVLALHGKKIGFDKVIKMIDNMVSTLKKEQMDDDSKKEYCQNQLDSMDDKKKSLERSVADEETTIANTKEGIATTSSEIASLNSAITALDKSVMEASVQRREENEAYKALMAENAAAKELLAIAKNRLNKFYNPRMYKPPAKEELSAQDRVFVSEGGTVLADVAAHGKVAPPPPPPTAAKEYMKKSGENAGVMQMINMLIMDLDKDSTEASTEEKDAQADYEMMMKDSAEKRASDSKSLSDKMSAKADLEAELQAAEDAHKSFTKELAATNSYIASLHAECDWLLQYYDVRKEARASEIDALGKAKAVLNGADFSLLQTQMSQPRSFLARA